MKETKELVKFVVSLAEAIEKSVKAGQAKDWAIIFSVLPGLVMEAVPAFSDLPKMKEELAAMTAEGKAELLNEVKALDLENDKAEKAVELALSVGVAMLDLVDILKK